MSTVLKSTPSDIIPTWQSQPKQGYVLTEFAHVFELLYGGAAGPGKSEYLLAYNILRRFKYPGTSGLFLRREYQQLVKSEGAIPRSHMLLHNSPASWNGSERTWTFPGGGRLEFGHIHSEEDKHNYQSAAYADIQFDELTQFLETQYLYMFSRARTTRPGCVPTIRGATNPGNVGHGWVKARFIDSMPPEEVGWFKRVRDIDTATDPNDPKGRSRVFVPGRLSDNPILLEANPDYEAVLEALPEDDMRALLHGDWNAWKGNVFKRWNRDKHVLEPFAIPQDWRRVAGLDWGVARPFVCEWIAEGTRLDAELARTLGREPDPPRLAPCDQAHRYVYREVSQAGLLDEEMARLVVKHSEGEQIRAWHADPASFFADRNRTGVIPAYVFAMLGVKLTQANNDRIMGKRAVDSALADCPCGVPRLRVFNTCLKLIKNLPDLPYDKTNIEDVDTDAADDEYDGIRYGLMGPRSQQNATRTIDVRIGPQPQATPHRNPILLPAPPPKMGWR